MRPSDLPDLATLAARKPHGVRIKYMAGCRCLPCRCANANYETARAAKRRAGEWNGLVPASRAAAHLGYLSAAGIGRRTVAAAAGIADSVIHAVRTGRKLQIRARTEEAILNVQRTAIAGGAHVDAGDTARRLSVLIRRLGSKAAVARALGYRRAALQINTRVCLARNAAKVERLAEKTRPA
jgi:hypothetical protein